MTQYILPLTVAVLLLIFYLGLPELDRIPADRLRPVTELIPRNGDRKKNRIDRIDLLIMACFLTVSGAVDFYRLGNAESVETFTPMDGKQAVISLESPAVPYRIALYSGVGYGNYHLEVSADGEQYTAAADFTQDAGDVLRWNYIYLNTGTETSASETSDNESAAQSVQNAEQSSGYTTADGQISFLRITGSGSPWLGEVCVTALDENGNEIQLTAFSDLPELTDEQEQFCAKYSFMNSTYFDEIYHARTAWEHLNNVYPYEISHPPLGKLIISVGIALFGMTPFGWRFSGTLFGVLMLPVLYVLLRKMFGSRRVATAGTLVFATDFMHFVQTRIATIDTYSVFFILLMYLFMYIYINENRLYALALSGVFFGMGAASKWTCIYAGAGLAVIWAVHRFLNRKEGFAAFARNAVFCIVFFVCVPCLIYYFSYIPYGTAQGVTNPFSRAYLEIVLSNQEYMFSYHSGLVATHPYSSVWYQWILDIRPILYYLEYDGSLRSSFGAWVNPVLCWGGLLALFLIIYEALFRHDRKALYILIGYLAQLLPWILVKRLTFEYHYFPSCVFLVLALSFVFSRMEQGNRHCRVYIWGLTGLSTAVFILFFPALTGIWVDNTAATAVLQWLPTWPF